MGTSSRLYAAVIATAAFAVLGVSPATAIAGKAKHTLKLVATQEQAEFLDLGAPGPSLGDEQVISETFSKNGKDVGVSGIVCTVTHVTPPYDVLTLQCISTLSLRRGQITLQGLIQVQGLDDPGPFTVAIIGGTGAFAGAGGTAVIRDTSETTRTYKLRFDSAKKRQHHG